MTTAVKAELSPRVLGTEKLARGRANCSVRTHTFDVPLFDGLGQAFVEYASRLRVRGGFTAIDVRACAKHPESCAAVQRVLEKDPTLTFNARTGRFEPSHSAEAPSPPTPPLPPPLLVLYSRPAPSPFPPAPSPPPPWHDHAEVCQFITTAAENNIEVADGLERAVCVYSRALVDERVRADKCFAPAAPSPPPPPPTPQSRISRLTSALFKLRVAHGEANGPDATPNLDSAEAYQAEHAAQAAAQLTLLDTLAKDNFQLRELLGGVRDKVAQQATDAASAGGRRLWQRSTEHASHALVDNVLASESIGTAPFTGITMAQCQALCSALDGASSGNTTLGTCQGIAFLRRVDPRDLELAKCYILKQLGGCSPGSFAGAVFARRDTDSCSQPTAADNPLCVQLAQARCAPSGAPVACPPTHSPILLPIAGPTCASSTTRRR